MKTSEKIKFIDLLGSVFGGILSTVVQTPITLGYISLWAWIYGLGWDEIAQPIAASLEYDLPNIPWIVWFGIIMLAYIVQIPWKIVKPLNLTKREQMMTVGQRVARLLTAIVCIYLFAWIWS